MASLQSVEHARGLESQPSLAPADRAERMAARLRDIAAATNALNRAPDGDELFSLALELLRAKLGLERCALYLVSPDGSQLEATFATDDAGAIVNCRGRKHEFDEALRKGVHSAATDRSRWCLLKRSRRQWSALAGETAGSAKWLALTVVQCGQELLGLLLNYSSSNGTALDEDRQELTAALCANLALIVAHRRSETRLRANEAKFRSFFENSIEGIYQTTPDGRYLSANAALARIYGYDSPHHLLNSAIDIANNLYVDSGRRAEFIARLTGDGTVTDFESQIRRRDGRIIWVIENARAVCDGNGEVVFYEGTAEDITARKKSEHTIEEQRKELQQVNAQLHELVATDPLTGIRNRRAFLQRLREEFVAITRYADTGPLSLIILDVDHFKSYNDTYGHPAGDEVLKKVAQVMSVQARATDFPARYGGEEFVAIMPHTDHAGSVKMAERMREAVEFAHWPHRAVTVSIGVSTTSPTVATEEQLIVTADNALYQSKRVGRNRSHHAMDLSELALPAAP